MEFVKVLYVRVQSTKITPNYCKTRKSDLRLPIDEHVGGTYMIISLS